MVHTLSRTDRCKLFAVDTLVASTVATGPLSRYCVGPFEDTITELGVRVLAADVDENEWHWFVWDTPESVESEVV